MVKMSETALRKKYLGGADVAGKPKMLTIKDVMQMSLGLPGEEEEKVVVYFDEDARGLVLNKTNARALVGLFGDDSEAWIGEPIVLYPAKATFGGKEHDVVRVRAPKKGDTAEPVPPAGDDAAGDDGDTEIPF